MQSILASSIIALAAALPFSSVVLVQNSPPNAGQAERPRTLFQKLEAAGATSGPAPRRDLNGSWTGPLTPDMGVVPPLTPLGQARFKLNIPDPFSASSNDPWRTCDPFGFPRSATTETRGVSFAQMPDRIVIMSQYQKVWRQVWMDGRELPKNIGGKGGPVCVARTSSEADEIEQWYAAAAERTAFLAGPAAFAFSAVYGTRDWICYVYGVACRAIADYYAASRQLYR